MGDDTGNDEQPEVQLLFEKARSGELSPAEFCAVLEAQGVHGVNKLPLVLKAFNLSFGEAKDIVITHDCGSAEGWVEEVGQAIDELPSDSLEEPDVGRENELRK